MRPLVPLLVATQYFAPIRLRNFSSKRSTFPPGKRPQRALRTTAATAFSSVSATTGHEGNGLLRMLLPPKSAGLSFATWALSDARAIPLTAASVMKFRRFTFFVIHDVSFTLPPSWPLSIVHPTGTTLGRDVAVKVLPDAFANDAERMAPF